VLKIGSLFSGIGGLELGLGWAGLGPVKWQVECDFYCLKILEKHWPDVKRYEKVEDCGKHNLEPVDLICGGFPCQDVSVAGKRAGLKKGTRSGLWFEMFRIISEIRPRYALIENVPGLVTCGGLHIILCNLAKIGYDAEWTYLSAKEVGAPHLRERVFILAYATRNKGNLRYELGSNGRADEAEQAGVGSQDVAYAEGESAWAYCQAHENEWLSRSGICRISHGVPHRVDRLRGLGAAVVPQVAQVIGGWILNFEKLRMRAVQ